MALVAFAGFGSLTATRWGNYPEFRVKLLGFCLRERVAPVVVARTIENRPEFVMNGQLALDVAIGADWSLLAVYRTVEVSWE